MRFASPISIDDILRIINHPVETVGTYSDSVLGINEFHSVQEGEVTFVDCKKYYRRVLQSKASVIFIDKNEEEIP
ncbi:MAG: hypothetical protein MJZ57_08785, partial [Bacteroidales bacterium]|nr:hypothetical protein [Bacteroidales bacterium]